MVSYPQVHCRCLNKTCQLFVVILLGQDSVVILLGNLLHACYPYVLCYPLPRSCYPLPRSCCPLPHVVLYLMLSRAKENEHALNCWPEGHFPELCSCNHQLCKEDQGITMHCTVCVIWLTHTNLHGTYHLALFTVLHHHLQS